jgi:uncharacterized membrane protein YfcA
LVPTSTERRPTAAFAAIGLVAGVFAGFFGVGGGIVVVPLLILLLAFTQRDASIASLVAIIPTSIVAASTFLLSGTVPIDQIGFGLMIAIGSTATAPLGTWALRTWNTAVVMWVFIVVLLVAAVQVFLVLPNRDIHLDWSVTTVLSLITVGALMGFASGLLGIGGGIIVVPILVLGFGVSDLTAKALSLIAMAPAAIAGTIGSARAGVVDWRAGVSLGIPMAVTSIVGAWLATVIPIEWANPLLAALIVYAGIQLAVRTAQSMRRG